MIPNKRNGRSKSHIIGNKISAKIASGQQTANSKHQNIIVNSIVILRLFRPYPNYTEYRTKVAKKLIIFRRTNDDVRQTCLIFQFFKIV